MTVGSGETIASADLNPFGNGSDGAFSETSGTTNLTQGQIYQYTSFLLDTSATLSASSTSEKPIIIYVSGNVTINGTIDLKGKGWPGEQGTPVGYAPIGTIGSNTNAGFGTTGEAGGSGGIGGFKGMKSWNFQETQNGFIMNGLGGGGGTGGSGGAAGGSTLFILCGGNLTFGASSTIDVSGAVGATNGSGGGDGGGGGGDILIFYLGNLTDSGVTKTVGGGVGGTGTSGTGGGGGSSSTANGTNASGSTAGAGGTGVSKIVAYNTIFWGAGGYPTV